LGEDLERHQKLLAELRQEYLQVKNRYTKETQLWAERQKFLEGKLADLEGTLQEQAAAFAEVESLRQQKTELEAALTKTNAKLTSLKQALASAQDVLSGVVLAPFPTAEPEVKEESEMLTGAQAAAAIEATLKAITNNLDSHTIQLENRLEALPLVPPSVLATVQKVLQSLVSNAIAASPQGSSISVKLLPSEDQSLPESLEIRITDQGGGLSEAAQSAFLSLLKGAENDLPQSIGDAQALQQAVALVEAAGGHWWIHTEPSRSSTYRISLPLNEQDVLS
jgi:signal transduction histidine kinase